MFMLIIERILIHFHSLWINCPCKLWLSDRYTYEVNPHKGKNNADKIVSTCSPFIGKCTTNVAALRAAIKGHFLLPNALVGPM